MLNHIRELAKYVLRIKTSTDNHCFHTTARLTNLKTFMIYRWNPETPEKKPEMKSYTIETKECGNMVLDALIKIKSELDPTLSFRRSCREGVCGTCGMNIGGVNTLACITPIRSLGPGTTKIYPLPHMYVIRDLVTDMSHFYSQYASIQPWLQRPPRDDKTKKAAYVQSERDQEKLVGLYECILCNCCSQSCPAYWWHYDKFYGPAVLLAAYRWVIDSRDTNHEERLNKLRGKYPVFACHTIMNCTKTCPKKLNPGYAVNELKRLMAGYIEKEDPDMNNPPCTSDNNT